MVISISVCCQRFDWRVSWNFRHHDPGAITLCDSCKSVRCQLKPCWWFREALHVRDDILKTPRCYFPWSHNQGK